MCISNVGADARSSDEEQVEDEEPAAPASDNEVLSCFVT